MNYDELEPRFTRGEYWLLEAVVRARLPICWLNWERIEEAINKKSHGLENERLIETLDALFSAGLIIASNKSDNKTLVLNSAQIEQFLDEKQSRGQRETYYGLTIKGGKVWEAFAIPNWDKYIINTMVTVGKDESLWEAEIISANQKRLIDYFELTQQYSDEKILMKTVVWDELRPWQATYWKELAVGYRLTYQYSEIENAEWRRRAYYESLSNNDLFYSWGNG